ncbi:hypothetical protein AX17_002383 [Amanita inopinata Kibby_2008]|nr:hypothetical protein AX17_002383 [Amanita inopinata Kibby_2008]
MEQSSSTIHENKCDLRPAGQQPFKVYKPCNNSIPIPIMPDDYYTPTSADIRGAQMTLAARTQALTDAPLQTRAMRESSDRARRQRWPFTTIRVKFPDRTQLEKVFPSSDKIKSVYAFVRGCLSEEAKPTKFILYQSPPKRDLKVSDSKVRELTLAELQLAPSSLLLLRFESEELNSTTASPPLAPFVLAQAVDLPVPPTFDASSVPDQNQKAIEPNKIQKGKIPKWFNLGISESAWLFGKTSLNQLLEKSA